MHVLKLQTSSNDGLLTSTKRAQIWIHHFTLCKHWR